MWAWLTAVVRGVADSLVAKVVEEAKKPDTLEDAPTNREDINTFNRVVSDRLRGKEGDNGRSSD